MGPCCFLSGLSLIEVFASFQVIRLGDGGDAHLMKHDSAEHGPGGEVHPGLKS